MRRRGALQAPAAACLLVSLLCFFTTSGALADTHVNTETKPASKIVSLAPSNTELIYSIGAADKLVGDSTFCDFPPAAEKLEKVGTFISANLERLTRIKPDAVLVVSGQEQLSSMLSHNGFRVILYQNNKLPDISRNLRALGDLTGEQKQANAEAQSFDDSLVKLRHILAKSSKSPNVFYCVWPQPLLTAGKSSFLNDCLTACSGTNIAGSLPAAYPQFSTEKLVLSDPDIIFLPYEAQKQKFLSSNPWSSLRAVKSGKVFYLPPPKQDFLARPTLRIIDGLYWLAQRLHPEAQKQLNAWHTEAIAGRQLQ
jgi:iron complex transport system substrate-binding protein